jgi:hypothetical protein
MCETVNVNTHVVALLRCIGFFEGTVKPVSLEGSKELFKIAAMNKVGLFFLESLGNLYEKGWFKPELDELREKHQKTRDLITYVADLFRTEIDYLLFKTLKPFPHTPSDIDILFHTRSDFCQGYERLRKDGLIVLDRDPYGMTMYSDSHNLNVDLHMFPAISGLPYLDTDILFRYGQTVEFASYKVRTLEPVVEFLVVAAHSFYKEHMFNLSDFYTLFSLAKRVEPANLCRMTEICNVSDAIYTVVKLCKWIMEAAFGNAHPSILSLERDIDELDVMPLLSKWVKLDAFPYKYPKLLIVQSLMRKIMKDSLTRSFILPTLAWNMRRERVIRLTTHFSRKSY